MSDVVDWAQAVVGWTEDGLELSVPLAPAVSPRQAKAVADAAEQAVHALYGEGLEIGYVEPDADSPAELLITAPNLLQLDPVRLRAAAGEAANRAANETFEAENREAPAVAAWLQALRGF